MYRMESNPVRGPAARPPRSSTQPAIRLPRRSPPLDVAERRPAVQNVAVVEYDGVALAQGVLVRAREDAQERGERGKTTAGCPGRAAPGTMGSS
jgi:hypothetical protein